MEMKNDIIYECLSNDEIEALDTYGQEKRFDILGLIADLCNAGMNIDDAIKLSFESLKEY